MTALEGTDQDRLLEVRDLVVDYTLPRRGFGHRPKLRAVAGVSLDVRRGETVGLVGESGSGKTTIGRAILGLAKPTSGAIRFEGTDLIAISPSARRAFSSMIQVVFQNPYTSLNPAIPVSAAIAEPLRVHRGLRGDVLDAEVRSLLQRVGLDPASGSRFPHAFSGGQRQRIAIARAIALNPRFVVYDEAVSALDVSTRGQIINLLAALRRDFGLASLFIGHDLGVVRHISDRIAVLYRGHLVESGPADAVADHPRHPYTQRLVQSVLVPDPDVMALRRQQQLRRFAGDLPSQGCPYFHECPIREPLCAAEAPVLRAEGDHWVACHLAVGTSTDQGFAEPSPRPQRETATDHGRGQGRRSAAPLACIEVGGSGIQTVLFDGPQPRFFDGVRVPATAEVALALPGMLRDGRLVSASNLGWRDVDATAALGITTTPTVVCNDAEAAALGEWVLRGKPPGGLVLVGLGTGVGGAVVRAGGATVSNVLGHQPGFSDRRCRCGAIGCLETVAAGWALPESLPETTLRAMAGAVATAIDREQATAGVDLVVAAGGVVDRNPRLVQLLAEEMTGRTVAPSLRPAGAKSAAAWGLRHLCALRDGSRTANEDAAS